MFKRITWWIVGAAMGGAGSAWAQYRVKKAVRRRIDAITPTSLVDAARTRVRGAIADGRDAARSKERELKGRISGAP